MEQQAKARPCVYPAVAGVILPAPATAPAPASPAGLSRSARNLRQLPAAFASGGLAILQQVQQSISTSLRTLEPSLANEFAQLNATVTDTILAAIGGLAPEVSS